MNDEGRRIRFFDAGDLVEADSAGNRVRRVVYRGHRESDAVGSEWCAIGPAHAGSQMKVDRGAVFRYAAVS